MKRTGTVIIGGGLSGLYAAHQLAGSDFILLEARSRLGGRIYSEATESNRKGGTIAAIDLGPSWFWPHQQRMQALIAELGLASLVYEQHSAGNAVMEYPDGQIVTGQGSASMAGSFRLDGGLQRLIDTLAATLDSRAVMTDSAVSEITRGIETVTVTTVSGGQLQSIECNQVVIALPPRVAVETLTFKPALPDHTTAALRAIPTWMAGQAKFIAVYEQPFWRQQGLSGDGVSHRGPLVEIHDASPKNGGPYALFGFVGVAAAQRGDHADTIVQMAIKQVVRMFGEQAAQPRSTWYKDWAFDPLTSIELDRGGQRAHPSMEAGLLNYWDNQILWAGTEAAAGQDAGYLEGALLAGERVGRLISKAG